jgi:hypothetical protein
MASKVRSMPLAGRSWATRRRVNRGEQLDAARGEDAPTSGSEDGDIDSEEHAALLERAPAAPAVDPEDVVADMVTAQVLSTAPEITSQTAHSSTVRPATASVTRWRLQSLRSRETRVRLAVNDVGVLWKIRRKLPTLQYTLHRSRLTV